MKKAILLVSFGTSWRNAGESSIQAIGKELLKAGKDMPVYQAYTSGVIVRKLAREGVRIFTVDEAVGKMEEDGISEIFVISTHMIPGIEYRKMLDALKRHERRFHRIRVAAPVLDREEDCEKLVPVIREILALRDEYEYVLMGHGTKAWENIRYSQMNEAFEKAGLLNIRIASVEAKPDIADALLCLSGKEKVQKVILHPFMVVAGDHAWNDMAGEDGSYLTVLKEAGYPVDPVVKGLGEYPVFRQIFVDKLEELISES